MCSIKQGNKKLNILIVTTEFLNDKQNGLLDGGIANEYYKFAKGLIKKGHKVTVLTARHCNYIDTIFNGIHVIEQNVKKSTFICDRLQYLFCKIFCKNKSKIKKGRYLFFKGLKKTINQLISKEKFDIIQYTSEGRLALCNVGNIPQCIRIASYYKNFINEYEIPYDAIGVGEEAQMYTQNKFVFGPSEYIANLIKTDLNLKDEIKIIETPFEKSTNDVDLTYFNQIKDKKYILFFGTLGVLKGCFDLAEIVYEVLDKHQDLNIVFVGKQVEYNKRLPINYIRKKAKEYRNRIIYFDKMTHKYLYPIIQNAEFCLMPSRTENFSNTCLEAMGFSKIVLGTTPYFDQIIKDGVNGFLCEPKKPESLLSKIGKILNLTDEEKREIEKNALKRINKCNLEDKTNELIDYYNYVINNWSN